MYPEYISVLSVCNGFTLENARVPIGENEWTGGLDFLGLREDWLGVVPTRVKGGLAFARDACGNFFLVLPSGTVKFLDHDTHERRAIARTMRDFLAGIELVPETPRPPLPPLPSDDYIALAERALYQSDMEAFTEAVERGGLNGDVASHRSHALLRIAMKGGNREACSLLVARGASKAFVDGSGHSNAYGAAVSGAWYKRLWDER